MPQMQTTQQLMQVRSITFPAIWDDNSMFSTSEYTSISTHVIIPKAWPNKLYAWHQYLYLWRIRELPHTPMLATGPSECP